MNVVYFTLQWMIPQGLLHMRHEPWRVGKNILYFNINFNFLKSPFAKNNVQGS
jgi:hypothetical protein